MFRSLIKLRAASLCSIAVLSLLLLAGRAAAQGYEPTHKYGKFVAGCVNGFNMAIYRKKTVLECTKICDDDAKCLAFEIHVAYGGRGGYKPGDCQPQSSADRRGCDGKHHNLDLYVKGANIRKTTTSTLTTTTTTHELVPRVDKMAEQIKKLEAALNSTDDNDAKEQLKLVKTTLDAADVQIQEQAKTITKLTIKINEEKVAREALAKTVGSIPGQLAALKQQMEEQEKAAALNDDNILEVLDEAAKSATKDAPSAVSTLDSTCGKDGCAAPQISTTGQDLLIEAPAGKVGIFSKQCAGGVDVCELARLAEQVKEALKTLGMGDA